MPSFTAPFPDFARLNRRIHDRIDPWFARRGIRRATWILLAGVLAFSIMWISFAYNLPTSEKLLSYQPSLPTNVRGYDGNPVQTFARERRVELAFDEYPAVVVQAFISAEDKTFFEHGGLDYPGLTKAVFNYGLSAVGEGGRVPGASTITQQVAKYLLQDDEYAVSRKVREMILAFRLESTLSKEQILELYLNSIFLGRNAYGIQAASRAYFDKDVADLTLHEAAYLAVLPKAPSNYDPLRATKKATDRRNYVLREMAANGHITDGQRAEATGLPLGTIRYGSNEKFRQMGGYFMEEVRRDLLRRFGEKAEQGPNSVYAGGLWVRSSMVPLMQDAAADALREGLAKFDGGRGWQDTKLSIDIDGDWRGQLSAAALGTGFPDWRKAVVLSKTSGSARLGFSDGSEGTLAASAAQQSRRGGGGTAYS
ncbi:MAG: transglycosylase domain-containing protein, partial [Pseudomonadota bacterium]